MFYRLLMFCWDSIIVVIVLTAHTCDGQTECRILLKAALLFSRLLTACDFVGAVNFFGRRDILLLQQRRKQILR